MNKQVIKARDVMHEKHLELDGLATVSEALALMKADKADVVIVKKRDEHDAYGIVLLSDIAKKVLAKNRSAERVNIYEIMSKPVITLEPDLDVRYCARLFERFGLSNAPVVENGQVRGIVSYNELVFQGLCELADS
ncbi:CBS domain-containing protein [Pseudomaricurvus alkylphenolicus]|jgi:CBS domain-containing protein|uniref:CBS domain-containing protein n=1 Tax=Pseudomaricurvus alkylphenolicus TaxID=1306991 RepID=UPI001422C3E8|nr:CBS domain-containing protein [Pseudomaricurvus alkylphenolicus]NIB44945.1 CBS domain-containing protein [Pseudomaricurvus alkylphenolicus]